MGCCESSPNDISFTLYNVNGSSSLTPDEMKMFREILNKIPAHGQQAIINLPVRLFLHIYQHHLIATYHLTRMECQLALPYEIKAIKDLETLLPEQKDHFIFIDMYFLLAMCLSDVGAVSAAIEGCQMALNMLLKHTPTDYTQISRQYFFMSSCYLRGQWWNQGIRYLRKAIEAERLSNEPNREEIEMMEATLHWFTARLMDGLALSFERQLASDRGENQQNVEHQIITEGGAHDIKCGTHTIDQAELERLFDKQTESLVSEEILKDVLENLKTYLQARASDAHGTNSEKMTFLVVHFKSDQMKTSSLSPMIIEGALTIIIDRMNNENTTDDEQYALLKQLPFSISYTDESELYKKGVREFQISTKEKEQSQKH